MKFELIVGLVSAIGMASACKERHTQCGGRNYHGETCCMGTDECRRLNDWYYYCEDPAAPIYTTTYRAYQTPSYQAPSYQAPTYQAPTYQAPTYRNFKKRDNAWGNWGNWGAWKPNNAPLNSAVNNNPWGNFGNFGNFGNNNNNNNNNNANSWANWGNWWDQGNNNNNNNVPAQNNPIQNNPAPNPNPDPAPAPAPEPAPAPAPETNIPTQTQETAPVQNNNNSNTNTNYSANENVKWPKAQKSIKLDAPIVVKAGQVFDGLKENNGAWVSYGRGVNAGDCKNVEGGSKDAVFSLESGATLRNVILGSDSVEHVHCIGDGCTVENVWWNDVCEDALSLKGSTNQNAKFYLRGGGAKDGSDKIVQHNSAGTVYINGFDVKNAGKLYRSCGNCKSGYQNTRHVIIENVNASNVNVLAGINSNFGDTATFKNVNANGGTVCETFTGNNNGGEPQKIGSQCKGQANCTCK